MCKNSYEKMSEKTKKIMIFCELKKSETNELLKLCVSQRYCGEEGKYVPAKQKQFCKFYE